MIHVPLWIKEELPNLHERGSFLNTPKATLHQQQNSDASNLIAEFLFFGSIGFYCPGLEDGTDACA